MKPAQGHWEHFNPVRVVAGAGTLAQLPRLLPESGSILLVTTPGFTRRGVTGRVLELLGHAAGRQVVVSDSITPNPELDDLDAMAHGHASLAPCAVVALGGGSAIDAGKVLAAILGSPEPRPLHRTFREGATARWNRHIPMVAVPTTAGTGSEATPFATVWDPRTHRKYSVSGESVYPHAAILDPELTLDLGEDHTLFPALDTVSHALESLWNVHATPMSEALALQALRLSVDNLPRVLADGGDLPARAGMQQASYLAGQAISTTRTALAHSISYPLTLHHGMPHGLACSFTLPALLRKFGPRLGTDGERQALLQRVGALLGQLRLHDKVSRFATAEQVLARLPQMFTPERAGNFLFEADVESLLRESLEARG
ncbi:phosphonoacetaldehyde reductase [Arenimonas donghaensis]|uniref:Uncharacterized protein n=1 Tax=Arenimonas donghaensis DSM 18148 = HO3-R19 TaxID=1121014 RepID=A0A087MG89_9GAMM|nr:phosphonoacetaldehyde reductase [Arenimonas donghaensis]KFL35892.1 hypothetical protein N788_06360 [Arenimonas donghaensis DSM 18148 = HO3-R19]